VLIGCLYLPNDDALIMAGSVPSERRIRTGHAGERLAS
jgi:hypothetical protein